MKDFLSGKKILEEVHSDVNGKLTVVKDFAWGTYIKTGSLSQSGGVVNNVWNTSLKELAKSKKDINNCLILGLGGGGMIKIINKYWMNVEIVGVDVDPVIVDLGKKYMKLDEYDIKIVIEDASLFVIEEKKNKYDLVCVDVYVQDAVPKKFTQKQFIKDVKKLLSQNGVVIFNRLYYGDEKIKAVNFRHKLREVFDHVETVYPEANIMFICNK